MTRGRKFFQRVKNRIFGNQLPHEEEKRSQLSISIFGLSLPSKLSPDGALPKWKKVNRENYLFKELIILFRSECVI